MPKPRKPRTGNGSGTTDLRLVNDAFDRPTTVDAEVVEEPKPKKYPRRRKPSVPNEQPMSQSRVEVPGRNRLMIRLEGKMADLYQGKITVADMDDEELAKLRFKDKNGNWTGRPPANLPLALVNMCRNELYARMAQRRDDMLDKAHKELQRILEEEEVKDSDKLKAIAMVLDRQLGKVPDRVELSSGERPFEVTMTHAIRRPTAEDFEQA